MIFNYTLPQCKEKHAASSSVVTSKHRGMGKIPLEVSTRQEALVHTRLFISLLLILFIGLTSTFVSFRIRSQNSTVKKILLVIFNHLPQNQSLYTIGSTRLELYQDIEMLEPSGRKNKNKKRLLL